MSKRWVYAPIDGAEFKLVIKKTTQIPIDDGHGGIMGYRNVPPVFLRFTKRARGGAIGVINEEFAKSVGFPIETLVQWVEASADYNKRFTCIESPDMEDKPDLNDKNMKSNGPKVVQGPRTTGDRK